MNKASNYLLMFLKNYNSVIVHTSSISGYLSSYDKDKLFGFDDARTVAYVGTGMAAESQKIIVVMSNGDNEYRSLQPGLTEAFYRQLPIVAVTISDRFQVDNKAELKDTVINSYVVSSSNTEEEALGIINKAMRGDKPCHIDFNFIEADEPEKITQQIDCKLTHAYTNSIIAKNLNEKHYLYISNDIQYDRSVFNCKICSDLTQIGHNCVVSFILGASLSNKHEKYYGIVTENEVIHDLNTFGNREFNNKITIFVYQNTGSKKTIIKDYVESLNYVFVDGVENYDFVNDAAVVWVLR